jgi:hypothetical protein
VLRDHGAVIETPNGRAFSERLARRARGSGQTWLLVGLVVVGLAGCGSNPDPLSQRQDACGQVSVLSRQPYLIFSTSQAEANAKLASDMTSHADELRGVVSDLSVSDPIRRDTEAMAAELDGDAEVIKAKGSEALPTSPLPDLIGTWFAADCHS